MSVAAIRSFNRFYTRKIGVLDDRILGSSLSLPETRVLYEVANRNEPTAAELVADLGFDPGYLSRLVRKLTNDGYIIRRTSAVDARQHLLSLTDEGKAEF